MKNIPFKVFAVLALCCAVGSWVAWESRTSDDRAARSPASTDHCIQALFANERISQVGVACARNAVGKHYDDVGMLLFAGLLGVISFGMGAILLGATRR